MKLTGKLLEVAEWYDKQPPLQLDSREYSSLRHELVMLFPVVNRVVAVGTSMSDPYKTFEDMRADIIDNRRLIVFGGGGEHPYWGRDANIRFRTVHDYFGHYVSGVPFNSLEAELDAFRSQARFHAAASLPALATEIVGQICSFYYHDKTYQPQKAVPMPSFLWAWVLGRE